MVNASTATTALPPAPPASGPVAIEESRAQRLQRQQARFRDRGGIFVPTNRNTLADILLGRKPRQSRSPRKSGRNVTLSVNVNDVTRQEASSAKVGDANKDTVTNTTGEKLKHAKASLEKPRTRIKDNTRKTANAGTKRRGRPPKILKEDDIPKGQSEEEPLPNKSSKVESLPKTKSKASGQRTLKKKAGDAAAAASSSCLEPDESHESLAWKGNSKDSETLAKSVKAKVCSTSEIDYNPTGKKRSRKEYSNQVPKLQSDASEVPQVKSKQKRAKARDKCEETAGNTKSRKKTSDLRPGSATTDGELGKPASCQASTSTSNKMDQEAINSSAKSSSVPEKKSSVKRSRKVAEAEAEEDEEKPIASKPKKRTKVEPPISVEDSITGKNNSKICVHKAGTKVVLKGKKTKIVTGMLPMPSMVLEILRRPPPMDNDHEPDPIDFLS